MEKFVKKVCKSLPCREKIVSELYELIGSSDETLPNCIFFYGHTGTGKTSLINLYFKRSKFNYIHINCIECYTSKILYETIINSFYNHQINDENNFAPYAKCENLYDFINLLRKLEENAESDAEESSSSYVICLDNAERLRIDMEQNILPSFLRLQELTALNICTILISQIPFEKYYPNSGLPDVVIKLHMPQYTKCEIQTILTKDFASLKENVKLNIYKNYLQKMYEDGDSNVEMEQKLKIIDNLQIDFYENYLNVFLNVFYRVCRDLPELRMISRDCFEIYCSPVIKGEIDCNDVSKLWRHIAKPFRTALSRVYMRIDPNVEIEELQDFESNQSIKRLAQSLELPYYAKYLLIAAFLASYNSPKEDKRLFVKNHGKQKKRLKSVNANAKLTEKMSTTLGPKSFTIDRLLAIFYAIIDEKVPLTCNLLSQISSLVHLKFLIFVSGEANVIEGSARIQCTVSLDFILNIGKIVGFNVLQYLCDFK